MSPNTLLSRGAICLLSENDAVPSCADKYSVDPNHGGENGAQRPRDLSDDSDE